jgi:KDO2-lipid IV(A) lauroyltransferase
MRLRHRLEAAVASAALGVLRLLGPAAASNFGGAVARAIGPLLPVSRVADANLRAAMPELDAAARRRVIRGVWDNLGRTAAELPYVGRLRRTDAGPGWEIVGVETIEALAARGGPALFLSAHLANWEVFQAAAATYGIQLAALYRSASNPLIDRMIRDLRRGAAGAEPKLFAKGAAGARGALGHLAKGGFLGMLVDQKMNDGIPAPFFGRTAMTAPAAAAFALRFRCPVLMVHAQRLGPARFRIVVAPPLDMPATGDRQADIAAMMSLVNATLESWIRARPGEWLWLHRRWPRPGDAAWTAPVAE